MMIHEITERVGRHKARKRVGRGHGSGTGKTSGRGHKGAASRAGWRRDASYEGGQMPLARRLPKRGFSNVEHAEVYHVVNVRLLETHCDENSEVTIKSLAAAGVLRDANRPLKVLGHGDLTKKLHISAAKFSKQARQKIESAGGSVTEVQRTKWRRDRTKKTKAQIIKAKASEAAFVDKAEASKAPIVDKAEASKAPKVDKPKKTAKADKPAKSDKPER